MNVLQDNPFHVRPSAAREATNTRATPGPSTPSKHGIAESMRAHLSELERIPDTIEKLERKYKAAEQSALKKQERIHQLEAQVLKLVSRILFLGSAIDTPFVGFNLNAKFSRRPSPVWKLAADDIQAALNLNCFLVNYPYVMHVYPGHCILL